MITTKLMRQLRITGTIFTTEELIWGMSLIDTEREGMAMAYDNFKNTPFDLNHDGHIDSNEAAYIYDKFYKEKNDTRVDFDDDDSDGDGWYPTEEELKRYNDDMDKLRRDVKAEKSRHIVITVVVIAAIWLLIGNNIIGALALLGLYILGSMFDFWS